MRYFLWLSVLAVAVGCGGGDPEPESECVYNDGGAPDDREAPQWKARCEAGLKTENPGIR
jgi:hypothetical protein